jgi:hypothetical protein
LTSFNPKHLCIHSPCTIVKPSDFRKLQDVGICLSDGTFHCECLRCSSVCCLGLWLWFTFDHVSIATMISRLYQWLFSQQSPRTGLALLQGVGPFSVCYSFFLKLYLMFNSDKTCSVFRKIFYGASVRYSALDFLCKLTVCRHYLLHGWYVFCHSNSLKSPACWCAESRKPLTIVAAKVTETNDATEALNNVLKSLQDQVSLPLLSQSTLAYLAQVWVILCLFPANRVFWTLPVYYAMCH